MLTEARFFGSHLDVSVHSYPFEQNESGIFNNPSLLALSHMKDKGLPWKGCESASWPRIYHQSDVYFTTSPGLHAIVNTTHTSQ
jgi:hypothetical protein